jgi:hypothetical protein
MTDHTGRYQYLFSESHEMLSRLPAAIMSHIDDLGMDDPWIESIHYNTTTHKMDDGDRVTWHDAIVLVTARLAPTLPHQVDTGNAAT